MNKTDSRRAFLDFCDTLKNTEKDKDHFLNAARLQRIERQPAFTGSQLVKLACLIAVAMIGSTGAVCMALLGNGSGCALVTIVSVVVSMLVGAVILMD